MNDPYPEKFTTYWANPGREGLDDIEKIRLAQAILKPLGLNPVNKQGIGTLDTVMSTRVNTYHGLSADDALALQDIGGYHCELARIDFCIDTETWPIASMRQRALNWLPSFNDLFRFMSSAGD